MTRSSSAEVTDCLSGLYASVIDSEDRPAKLPLRVAQDLEQRFLRDGWPVGRVYGSESGLAAHYGVGRDVMRETTRILEAREFARVRRGPHGGLMVTQPRSEHLLEMTSAYAYLTGISAAEIIEAWSVVHAAAARLVDPAVCARLLQFPPQGADSDGATARMRHVAKELIALSRNPVLEAIGGILERLLPPVCDEPGDQRGDTRGRWTEPDCDAGSTADTAKRARALISVVETENLRAAIRAGEPVPALMPRPRVGAGVPAIHVVQQVMASFSPAEWEQGRSLGSEGDLCTRYFADRSVVRQPIRMMEDSGTAISMPGRGRGLVTRRPGAGPLSRDLRAFLVSRSLTPCDAGVALDALMVEMTGLAAAKTASMDPCVISSLFDSLRTPCEGTRGMSQTVESLQYNLADNALLSLFLDGVKAFMAWQMGEQLLAPTWVDDVYASVTRDVFSAIARHDAEEAMRLQDRKLRVLERCRRRVVSASPDAA